LTRARAEGEARGMTARLALLGISLSGERECVGSGEREDTKEKGLLEGEAEAKKEERSWRAGLEEGWKRDGTGPGGVVAAAAEKEGAGWWMRGRIAGAVRSDAREREGRREGGGRVRHARPGTKGRSSPGQGYPPPRGSLTLPAMCHLPTTP